VSLEDSHLVHDFNLNPAKGQIPGVRWSKVPVPENLREGAEISTVGVLAPGNARGARLS
jgi:hypothetical protein